MRKPNNTRGKSVSLVVEGNVTPRSPCASPRGSADGDLLDLPALVGCEADLEAYVPTNRVTRVQSVSTPSTAVWVTPGSRHELP